MQIDVPRLIGAVTREVEDTERDGKPAVIVRATRTFDSTPDDVWDAITSPERLPRWFLPIEGELKPGGRYQLIGNAGGVIERCEPSQLLAVTWENMGDVSWLEVRLSPAREGKTLLVLEHTAYPPEGFWEKFGPGAVGVGWDLVLLGLGLHLPTGASLEAYQGDEWALSDEGKAYSTAASDEWARAAVTSGTDPEVARARAAQTTAFYTGAPPPEGAGAAG